MSFDLLKGLKVVDLSRVLAGPWASQLLADLGANVIKIERAGKGDDTRGWGPPYTAIGTEKVASYFACTNRGKFGLSADFRNELDRLALMALFAEADVIIENYQAGSLERVKLSHTDILPIYPHLIWGKIRGYASDDERCDRPGYDFIAQAESGLMAISGAPQGEPIKSGVAIVDIFAGMYLAVSILAAVHKRDVTGKGSLLEVSLADTGIAMLSNVGANYLATTSEPLRCGNTHVSIVPYQTFLASDDYFVIACGNDSQFKHLCNAIAMPHLADDERFNINSKRVENRELLSATLNQLFGSQPRSYWIERIHKADVPVTAISNVSEALVLAKKRNMVFTKDRTDFISNPIMVNTTRNHNDQLPAKLGTRISTVDSSSIWQNFPHCNE